MSLSTRQVRGLIIVTGLFLGCAAWVQLAFWQASRISPQFRSASGSAYRSIRECNDRITEEDASFLPCLDKAQVMIVRVRELAKTQQERLQYSDLHGYLIEVSDYHRELQASTDSDKAHQKQEQLVRYRNRLEKIFQ